jgi:hypothetical protein
MGRGVGEHLVHERQNFRRRTPAFKKRNHLKFKPAGLRAVDVGAGLDQELIWVGALKGIDRLLLVADGEKGTRQAGACAVADKELRRQRL